MIRWILPAVALIGLGLTVVAPAKGQPPRETSCTTCHADTDLFDEAAIEILESYRQDVHAEVGLSCHDCHGGNPSAAVADDMFAAMDEAFALNPYRGRPAREDVPGFCGGCHSSPSYMRRFRPDARVDQEREYWTSQHGQALATGDTNVATCVDCHGVHGTRRPADPESRVYPTRVAQTCGTCHADSGRMAGYKLPDGRPLPIDQWARWRQSVHAAAMIERDDLSAPTCNDCHGNHGAGPPGLDSVAFVCGQCHGREAELFRGSTKHDGFAAHNEYLLDAGEEGCPACHEPPEPQAWVTDIDHFGECTSCHDNHGTVRPTVAMFGVLPEYACSFCHENPGLLEGESTESDAASDDYAEALKRLLGEAADAQLEGEALYNWSVDQASSLDQHSVAGEADDEGRPLRRPEFSRLFDKFRIGKTYYRHEDPVSGEVVEAPIIRCNSCHVTGALVSDDTPGAVTGIDLVNRQTELTASIGRAERILLKARRGGVEIRDAQIEVDQAVDSQISLEVQVHGFSATEASDFHKTYEKGLEHAQAAITAGRQALQEIQSRRHWLIVALIATVATLIALGLKIHEISARERRRAARETA